MSKISYYSFHILWNFVISLILLIPFILSIGLLLEDYSRSAKVIATTVLGSLANSLYIMSLALFFYSEITGLNVIGTVNFVVSIATSMIPTSSPFYFLVYSNP